MKRLALLQRGVAGATLVAQARGALALTRPDLRDGAPNAAGRDVFAAAARPVLDRFAAGMGAGDWLSVRGVAARLPTGLSRSLTGRDVRLA